MNGLLVVHLWGFNTDSSWLILASLIIVMSDSVGVISILICESYTEVLKDMGLRRSMWIIVAIMMAFLLFLYH